jgi:asparagine synthase (glutamine-hydrolysing)
MCGIAGFLGGDVATSERGVLLSAMTDAITHRGPDGFGHFVHGPVAFGMRRLAIIDLGGGDQPISNEDGTITTVFNGEIYNFRELRAELEAKGHVFDTASDTEVIVHLYEEVGTDLFARLDGMFAIAIWDDREQRLVLGRDRFGKKPLFHAVASDGAFLFGSELKSLHRHPGMGRTVDPVQLAHLLVHDCVPSPRSLLKGVEKLDGGHFMVVDGVTGAKRIEQYWQLSYERDPNPPSYADAVEQLRDRLQQAVEARLVSDVPLGVFLSGGIDSSSVAAMMRRAGAEKIETFSIAFEEESFDESTHARAVAEHLSTEHHEELLSADRMLELIPQVADWLDEPIADPSILPTFVLSRFTKERVTVALGGDGGDEVFAGYPTYTAHKASSSYQRVPGFLRHGLIEPAVRALPASDKNFSLEFKAKRFISGANETLPRRHATWMSGNTPAAALGLLSTDARALVREHDLLAVADERNAEVIAPHWIDRVRYQDLSRYLRDVVLVKVDRASMAASLEVRAPFLDHHLVEWAAALPPEYSFHKGVTKRILKDAMRDLLPDGIVDRPKKGFGIPLAAWLKGPLRPMAEELLAPDRLRAQGLLDPDAVGKLLAAHTSGRSDNRKQLWPLLVFQLWSDRWLGTAARQSTLRSDPTRVS